MFDFDKFWNEQCSFANPKTKIAFYYATRHFIESEFDDQFYVSIYFSRRSKLVCFENKEWFYQNTDGKITFLANIKYGVSDHIPEYRNGTPPDFDGTPDLAEWLKEQRYSKKCTNLIVGFDKKYATDAGTYGTSRMDRSTRSIHVHCGRTYFSTTLETLMHELCHLKQDLNGHLDCYDRNIPHDERPQEIEAFEFAKHQCELLKPILKEKIEAQSVEYLL